MEKDLAKKVVGMLLTHAAELDESIRLVQKSCTPEEQRAYKLGVGHIFSEMYDRMIDPILREHPDAKPEDFGYVPVSGPTLAAKGHRQVK